MNDHLTAFEQYKDNKEISDLINEVRKLREYYSNGQYDRMSQHIHSLTAKYAVETIIWNAANRTMPISYQQSYINAESFLRLKGYSVLLEKGIKVQDRLTAEELDFIKSTFRTA